MDLFLGSDHLSQLFTVSYCFLHAGTMGSKQIVPWWKVRAIHTITCWTSTTMSRKPAVLAWSIQTKSRTESPGSKLNFNSCSGLIPRPCGFLFWILSEGFRIAMLARETLFWAPAHGPRTWSPHALEAVTHSDSWLRWSDPKKRWWVALI